MLDGRKNVLGGLFNNSRLWLFIWFFSVVRAGNGHFSHWFLCSDALSTTRRLPLLSLSQSILLLRGFVFLFRCPSWAAFCFPELAAGDQRNLQPVDFIQNQGQMRQAATQSIQFVHDQTPDPTSADGSYLGGPLKRLCEYPYYRQNEPVRRLFSR